MTTTTNFTNNTLRALGLNEAGVRDAWFRVLCTRYTARGNVAVTHCRCTTAAEANRVYQAHRAAGRDALIEVWWSGNAAPVRTWSLNPLTTAERAAL